jgi:hypothetical protein
MSESEIVKESVSENKKNLRHINDLKNIENKLAQTREKINISNTSNQNFRAFSAFSARECELSESRQDLKDKKFNNRENKTRFLNLKGVAVKQSKIIQNLCLDHESTQTREIILKSKNFFYNVKNIQDNIIYYNLNQVIKSERERNKKENFYYFNNKYQKDSLPIIFSDTNFF